jgi:nicotinamidase-related amidase
MTEHLLLVIDVQQAFCDVHGSLAQAYGEQELEMITPRLAALDAFLASYPCPENVFLIRSEYQPGQFTAGDLNHLFAPACVPGLTSDCEWSLSGDAIAGKRVITKTQESVATVPGFMEELQSMVAKGLTKISIAGFLTTSCVKKTALDIRQSLPINVAVGVLESFSASRASNYNASDGCEFSRHDLALREMDTAGVYIL